MILHTKSKYCLLKVKYGQNLGLVSPKLIQKGQNCIEKPKRNQKSHFSTQFETLSINFTSKYEYCIYKAKSGPKLGLIGPKLTQKANIIFEGLENQTRPFPHPV